MGSGIGRLGDRGGDCDIICRGDIGDVGDDGGGCMGAVGARTRFRV